MRGGVSHPAAFGQGRAAGGGIWLVAYGHLADTPEHLEAADLVPEKAAMFQWHDKEPYAS